MKREPLYTILACAVLALTVIPVGGAVFVLGFIRGDSPCVMCWEQRTAMVLIALIGLFVLRYGPRPKYIGLAVLVGAWGLHMGTRHASLHAMRDVGQGFSVEILGAHTYVWAAFIFMVCIVMMGVLLMSLKHVETSQFSTPPRLAGKTLDVGVSGRSRRQHCPGLCQYRPAAVRRAERSYPFLL